MSLTSPFLVQFKLLNPRLFKSHYEVGKDADGKSIPRRWADLDGSVLPSRTGKLPAKRACAFHAYWAVKHAEQNYELEVGKMTIPDAAFSSPDFDPTMVLRLLQDLKMWRPGTSRKLMFNTLDIDLEPHSVSPSTLLLTTKAMWHFLILRSLR